MPPAATPPGVPDVLGAAVVEASVACGVVCPGVSFSPAVLPFVTEVSLLQAPRIPAVANPAALAAAPFRKSLLEMFFIVILLLSGRSHFPRV